MEELNFLEKAFLGGLVLCWLINAVLPVILWLSSYLVAYWKRLHLNTYSWAYNYQEKKYNRLFRRFEDADAVGTFIFFDLVIGVVILKALIHITEADYLFPVTLVLGGIVGLIFIPRFIFDVCKTLKYKPKTGESETIEKLKEDVRLLKQQVDNKQD